MGVIEEMARAETEELVNDCQVERELEIDELREENAKLREFAREACDTARGLALNDPLADVSWLADRMRELGIEAE